MGAALVYQARTVLLMASGERKTDAVADAILMEPDCSVPISYGHYLARRGGQMIYVIDRVAAAKVLDHADELRRRFITMTDRTRQIVPECLSL
jgi:6-phosphogluconolactonase/glucosamine-6-phosphate isomerase/deaminase